MTAIQLPSDLHIDSTKTGVLTYSWHQFFDQLTAQTNTNTTSISGLSGARATGFVIPEDYGAVGDGVTNDAVAIQAAVDTGKSVFFPNLYLVSSTITVNSGFRMFLGVYATGGVRTTSNIPIFTLNVDSSNDCDFITFQNMTIAGANNNLAHTSRFGIKGQVAANGDTLSRLSINGCLFYDLRECIRLNDTGTAQNISWTTIIGNRFASNIYALNAPKGTGTGLIVTGNQFEMDLTNGLAAIDIGDGTCLISDMLFSANQFAGAGAGIRLHGNTGVNASIVCNQMDGGITPALYIRNLQFVHGSSNNWGGATSIDILNCLSVNIDYGYDVTVPIIAAGTADNYNPSGLSIAGRLLLSANGALDLTGLASLYGGRELELYNIGTNTITLKNAAGGSVAANRFSIGADALLTANTSMSIIYDPYITRWVRHGGI